MMMHYVRFWMKPFSNQSGYFCNAGYWKCNSRLSTLPMAFWADKQIELIGTIISGIFTVFSQNSDFAPNYKLIMHPERLLLTHFAATPTQEIVNPDSARRQPMFMIHFRNP